MTQPALENDALKTKSKFARNLILIWLLLGALALIFLPLGQWLEQFRAWILSLGWIAPLAYVAAYILFCIFLIPSMALSLGAAPIFGFWKGLVLTVIAANIGASAAFWLGRTLLHKRVERWAADKPRFLAVDNAVAKNGFKVVMLLRMSPIFPFTIFNYLLSLMRISYPRFALGTFLGMLPLNAAFLYVGCAAAEAVNEAAKERVDFLKLALKIVGIAMACIAMTVVSRIAIKAVK